MIVVRWNFRGGFWAREARRKILTWDKTKIKALLIVPNYRTRIHPHSAQASGSVWDWVQSCIPFWVGHVWEHRDPYPQAAVKINPCNFPYSLTNGKLNTPLAFGLRRWRPEKVFKLCSLNSWEPTPKDLWGPPIELATDIPNGMENESWPAAGTRSRQCCIFRVKRKPFHAVSRGLRFISAI